jgi:hypothetical protein
VCLLIEVGVIGIQVILRDFLPALVPNKAFQLPDSHLLQINDLFGLSVDPIIGIEFLLQLDNRFVSLVEP